MPRHTLTPRQLQRLGRTGQVPLAPASFAFPPRPLAPPSNQRANPSHAPIGPLDVAPLQIPNADQITPEGYDGAINIALRETLPEGVLVHVNYTTPRALDTVDVFWGDKDNPVASQTFEQAPSLPVKLYIPTDRIEAGDVIASCQVTAVGQSAQPSPDRKYMVKLDRPGGNDIDADEPGNQNMARARLPQHIIDNGVGPGDATAGVPVTITAWDNMALHDTCELHWGSETLSLRVETPDDIGRDMVFEVGEQTIRDAWDDVNLNITYKLVDRVNNSSRDSEERPWAPTTYVEVYANDSSLYEPWVEEAGADQEVIDLDALAGSPVHVEVDIERNSPYVGGTCTLIWRGVTADGSPAVDQQSLPVTRAPMALYFQVPSPVLEQIRGGRVMVYYTLSKGAASDHSARNSLDVIGEPLAWPAPHALDLNDDDELPIDTPFPRFSTPVYGGKATGDLIVLYMSGTRLDGQVVSYESPAYPVVDGEQDKPLVINVPKEQLALLDGTQATVFYKVNPNTALERTSDYLTVNVGVGSSQLRAPTVLQAVDGWFNPAEHPGGATLSVPRGTIQGGDKVTYFWRGSVTPVYDSWTVAGASGAIEFEIPPDLINPNVDGTVTAWYTVERGGALVGASPELLLNIGVNHAGWPAPGIVDATGNPSNPFNPIKPGTGNEENTATLTVVDTRLRALDVVAVVWRLPNGEDLVVPWESVVTDGRVSIRVPRELLAASVGQRIEVSYVVFRAGNPVGESQVLTFQVLDLPVQALPIPTISEATGAPLTLNLNAISGDATAKLAPWPFITAGQLVWLIISGTTDYGESWRYLLYDGQAVTEAQVIQGLSRPVAREYLLQLMNSSHIEVEAAVIFAPNTPSGDRTMFPQRSISLNQLQLTLPAPQAPNVSADGTVDMDALNGRDLNVTIGYTGVEDGQKLQLLLTVPGSAPAKPVFPVVTQPGSLSFKVSNADLQANAGVPMSLSYTVRRTAEAVAEPSVALPLIVARRGEADVPNVEYFDWYPVAHPNVITVAASIKVDFPSVLVSATGSFLIRPDTAQIVPPYGKGYYIQGRGVAIEFKKEASALEFRVQPRGPGKILQIRFFNRAGVEIGSLQKELVYGAYLIPYTAPAGQRIASLSFNPTDNDYVYLTALHLTY